VAEQLLVFQERIFSMTLIHWNYFGSYDVENVQSSCSIISFDGSV